MYWQWPFFISMFPLNIVPFGVLGLCKIIAHKLHIYQIKCLCKLREKNKKKKNSITIHMYDGASAVSANRCGQTHKNTRIKDNVRSNQSQAHRLLHNHSVSFNFPAQIIIISERKCCRVHWRACAKSFRFLDCGATRWFPISHNYKYMPHRSVMVPLPSSSSIYYCYYHFCMACVGNAADDGQKIARAIIIFPAFFLCSFFSAISITFLIIKLSIQQHVIVCHRYYTWMHATYISAFEGPHRTRSVCFDFDAFSMRARAY